MDHLERSSIRKGTRITLYGNTNYCYEVIWRGYAGFGNQFTIRIHTGDFIHLIVEGENIEIVKDDSIPLFPYDKDETIPLLIQNIHSPTSFKSIDVPKHNGFHQRFEFFRRNNIETSEYGYLTSSNSSLFN
jgi:hypothetical protein